MTIKHQKDRTLTYRFTLFIYVVNAHVCLLAFQKAFNISILLLKKLLLFN